MKQKAGSEMWGPQKTNPTGECRELGSDPASSQRTQTSGRSDSFITAHIKRTIVRKTLRTKLIYGQPI